MADTRTGGLKWRWIVLSVAATYEALPLRSETHDDFLSVLRLFVSSFPANLRRHEKNLFEPFI